MAPAPNSAANGELSRSNGVGAPLERRLQIDERLAYVRVGHAERLEACDDVVTGRERCERHVVEVVGHAGRQASDHLHLLALAQDALERILVREEEHHLGAELDAITDGKRLRAHGDTIHERAVATAEILDE